MNLLVIDLYCGLGGWAEGFLAEGFDVIGFDIEQQPYPGQLVLQDVLTLHGSQFHNTTCIVASPPCQEPSYRMMPWKRAKALNAIGPPIKFIELFNTCFRIQREACEKAGRHIPIVVENVRGAQPWVGRAKWHYGSYYLWGDVPALMPLAKGFKSSGMNWSDRTKHGQDFTRIAGMQRRMEGIKVGGASERRWEDRPIKRLGDAWFDSNLAALSSHSKSRKAASAQIAKIPFPLALHIARVFKQYGVSDSARD